MTEPIVIDTDDLREVARTLQGALQQLGDIRLDLIRASADLVTDPAVHAGYQQVLAGLNAFGGVVTADHDALVSSILAIEAEEGPPPAAGTGAIELEPAPTTGSGLDWSIVLLVFGIRRPPAPEPWNRDWVSSDGTMPPQPTVPATGGFGATWETRGSFDSGLAAGSGRAGASVSGWVYGEADSRVDERGNRHASARVSAGIEASAHASGRLDLGPVHASGEAEASVRAQAEAQASGSVGPDGIHGSVSASAEAEAEARAAGSVGVDGVGEVGLEAEAEAAARAAASAAVGVGPDGVEASGSAGAMAGASAGAGWSVEGPAGTEVGASANVKTGIGVEVSGSASVGWEKVGFQFEAGAALGIGGGISLNISISPKEIFEALSDPIGLAEGLVEAVVDTGEWIGEAAVDVADAVSEFFDPTEPVQQVQPAQQVQPVPDRAAGGVPVDAAAVNGAGWATQDPSAALERAATAADDFFRPPGPPWDP